MNAKAVAAVAMFAVAVAVGMHVAVAVMFAVAGWQVAAGVQNPAPVVVA